MACTSAGSVLLLAGFPGAPAFFLPPLKEVRFLLEINYTTPTPLFFVIRVLRGVLPASFWGHNRFCRPRPRRTGRLLCGFFAGVSPSSPPPPAKDLPSGMPFLDGSGDDALSDLVLPPAPMVFFAFRANCTRWAGKELPDGGHTSLRLFRLSETFF